MMRREEGETAKTRAYAASVCPCPRSRMRILVENIIRDDDFRSPDPMTVLKIVKPPSPF
jgi:hypothetical protein